MRENTRKSGISALCAEDLQKFIALDWRSACSRCPRRAGALGRKVGGLDFGFHNPFAAVWGALAKDDILWLTGEHYESHRPLSYHITRIPRDVEWYADPSGANEIAELRCAGFTVNKGVNALALGIAAVSGRR